MRFFLLFAGFMVSCGGAIAQAPPKVNERALRAALEETLKDSESARFRQIKHKPSGSRGIWTICGEVNAKNGYGGYAGYEPFVGTAAKETSAPVEYLILGVGEAAGLLCKKEGLR